MKTKVYPRFSDKQTVYLNAVVKDPQIEVGDYTIYNDFVSDPLLFEKNNVLYHYPIHSERLIIGKFCSIACGAKFLFNCANHTLKSLSTYTFPLFYEEWGLDKTNVSWAWDNKGDIIIGNDVWIGYGGCDYGRSSYRRWCDNRCVCRSNKRCSSLYNRRGDTCQGNTKTF